MATPRVDLSIAATLLAAILWGTSFVVNDAGLAHVGPSTFAALRFLLAGAVALTGLALVGRLGARLLRSRWLWALGAANAAAFLMQYYGQTLTTPARTALFVNCGAFAVAALERLVFREPLGRVRVAALFVGVAGAAVLIAGGDPAGLAGGQTVGDLLAIASGVTWAVYFVLNRKAVRDEDPVAVTGWTFALSGIMLLPALLVAREPLPVAREGWLAIAYAGIVTTAIAFALWAYGLRRITATTSAVLLLFEVLVAALLSFAIGRESFGAIDLVGAALLVAALVGVSVAGEAPRREGDQA